MTKTAKVCPDCLGDNVERSGTTLRPWDDEVWCTATCPDCNKEWTEVYTYTGRFAVMTLEPGEES